MIKLYKLLIVSLIIIVSSCTKDKFISEEEEIMVTDVGSVNPYYFMGKWNIDSAALADTVWDWYFDSYGHDKQIIDASFETPTNYGYMQFHTSGELDLVTTWTEELTWVYDNNELYMTNALEASASGWSFGRTFTLQGNDDNKAIYVYNVYMCDMDIEVYRKHEYYLTKIN